MYCLDFHIHFLDLLYEDITDWVSSIIRSVLSCSLRLSSARWRCRQGVFLWKQCCIFSSLPLTYLLVVSYEYFCSWLVDTSNLFLLYVYVPFFPSANNACDLIFPLSFICFQDLFYYMHARIVMKLHYSKHECMSMFLCACVCICLLSANSGQKVSDPLNLMLWMVVSLSL